MIRRNARLRKEYLYRKGLEGKERVAYEHKRKVREALEGADGSAADSRSCSIALCPTPKAAMPVAYRSSAFLPPALHTTSANCPWLFLA